MNTVQDALKSPTWGGGRQASGVSLNLESVHVRPEGASSTAMHLEEILSYTSAEEARRLLCMADLTCAMHVPSPLLRAARCRPCCFGAAHASATRRTEGQPGVQLLQCPLRQGSRFALPQKCKRCGDG